MQSSKESKSQHSPWLVLGWGNSRGVTLLVRLPLEWPINGLECQLQDMLKNIMVKDNTILVFYSFYTLKFTRSEYKKQEQPGYLVLITSSWFLLRMSMWDFSTAATHRQIRGYIWLPLPESPNQTSGWLTALTSTERSRKGNQPQPRWEWTYDFYLHFHSSPRIPRFGINKYCLGGGKNTCIFNFHTSHSSNKIEHWDTIIKCNMNTSACKERVMFNLLY